MGQTPIAEELAKAQKEISVAEFFERNKQLLGFDSPTRAILTSVKEAVDNALDACEEASILPEVIVKIETSKKKNAFILTVEDNGPGIVKKQIPNIFARLLYGSRFHAIRQARGQQGIGISAVVLYSQQTTGRPAKIISKIAPDQPAYEVELLLDTKTNRPETLREEVLLWNEKEHGTRITVELVARYLRGKQSVFEYLRNTAIVNPHATITLMEPDGTVTLFKRVTDKIPAPVKAIQPHPQGTELGTLLSMARGTENYKMSSFLVNEFSRVSPTTASKICEDSFVDEEMRPQDLNILQAQRLINTFAATKFMMPPTDCLSPIGEILIRKGMRKETKGAFIVTHTRPKPSVVGGNPFQIEAGLSYGGDLRPDEQIQILRFANRVPLLFQQGACAITHAIESINWKRYGLEQKGSKGIPTGPAIVMVHVASTKIPFTSEAKEAVADIPEMISEIELAIRACAKRLNTHLRKKARYKKMQEKETIIRKLIPLIAEKSAHIVGKPTPPIDGVVAKIMNSVLVEDTIDYDPKRKVHIVKALVTNYTSTAKTFELIAQLPPEATGAVIFKPEPGKFENNVARWQVKKLGKLDRTEICFDIKGLDQEDYDENDLFVNGIDAELVTGADPWNEDAFQRILRGEVDEEEGADFVVLSGPVEGAEPIEEAAEKREEDVAGKAANGGQEDGGEDDDDNGGGSKAKGKGGGKRGRGRPKLGGEGNGEDE